MKGPRHLEEMQKAMYRRQMSELGARRTGYKGIRARQNGQRGGRPSLAYKLAAEQLKSAAELLTRIAEAPGCPEDIQAAIEEFLSPLR